MQAEFRAVGGHKYTNTNWSQIQNNWSQVKSPLRNINCSILDADLNFWEPGIFGFYIFQLKSILSCTFFLARCTFLSPMFLRNALSSPICSLPKKDLPSPLLLTYSTTMILDFGYGQRLEHGPRFELGFCRVDCRLNAMRYLLVLGGYQYFLWPRGPDKFHFFNFNLHW